MNGVIIALIEDIMKVNTVRPKIICLSRLKNESWFLEIFLKCTELWADKIILADQNSTDNSIEIASKFNKVKIIKVSDKIFDEYSTNKLLISAARQIRGQKILFGIDIDEIFTANLLNSLTWSKILKAPKGTEIKFSWACITPDLKRYWEDGLSTRAYVDDGKKYSGTSFHSLRLPTNNKVKPLIIRRVKQFHFQFTDWQRMRSKHRWYQMFERIQNPNKSFIEIFRTYHHMDAVPKNMIKIIPESWYKSYLTLGINIFNIRKDKEFWWDTDILHLIQKYGANYFKTEDIWSVNWEKMARKIGYKETKCFRDPRDFWIKAIHIWLRISQPYSKRLFFIRIDNLLTKFIIR